MPIRTVAATLLFLCATPLLAADKYTVKVVEAEPPKSLAEPIRNLLTDKCVQVTDGSGEVLADIWFPKEVPAKATKAQIENGLTYRQLAETTILAVVSVPKDTTDYRRQKVPAGVYTMRLAYQPMDGDHMGTAPYGEFCLASPAADDKSAATMQAKTLHELSAKSTGGHVAVFLLFPGRDAGDAPKIVDKGDGHWVLFYKQAVNVDGTKATLGIGLTLLGHSPSA